MLWTQETQPSENTTNFDHCDDNIVVDKKTDNAEPLSICFLPQYSTPKKIFISSERDQNHDTKKEQALSITFSKYDWFISQNGRSWFAITLRDKLTRAWRVQRCLDSYRQRKISQSDCEITSNCGKTEYRSTVWYVAGATKSIQFDFNHYGLTPGQEMIHEHFMANVVDLNSEQVKMNSIHQHPA